MVCSNKLRVQGNPIQHKNPSNGSKPWIFGKKYSVFKFLDHGDERHSKNGLLAGDEADCAGEGNQCLVSVNLFR